MSNISKIKADILSEMERTAPGFHRVSYNQVRIRCPICGDSQKNLKDAHCYIKCDLDNDDYMLYHCFKCPAKGRVNKYFLDKLNIHVNGIETIDNQLFNRITSVKDTHIDIITGLPNIDSDQVGYIKYRLGDGFTEEDYDRFKIVWDMDLLLPHISDTRVKNTLPSNKDSVSFLSDDKSILLTRFFSDEFRWKKTKLFPSDNRSFYTIKSEVDLFTDGPVTINIAEGVFDILSIYKNFNTGANSVYVACLGSDYDAAITYAIAKGLIGDNVKVKIYIDSDQNVKTWKYRLKKFKWLFNSMILYRNVNDKDVGIKIDKIKLIEETV